MVLVRGRQEGQSQRSGADSRSLGRRRHKVEAKIKEEDWQDAGLLVLGMEEGAREPGKAGSL